MAADRIILGNSPKAVYSTDCSVNGVNNNVIVCAGTGSGKTMSITEPRLLTAFDTNLIVTCTKRKIVDKYSDILKERGYSILDMNFTVPKSSNICYDPMQFIHSDTDIRFAAQSIVLANPKKNNNKLDPYWDETAITLLCAVISFVRNSVKNATFSDVLDIIDNLEITGYEDYIETNMDYCFDLLTGNKYCISQWNTFRALPETTARCVLSTLTSALNSVFTPDLREMIKTKKNIDFQNFADNKTVLFISSSAVNPALNRYINLFYSQMFKDMFEYAESRPDKKLPHPVSVIADDFATGSRIQNFPEYISIFREKTLEDILNLPVGRALIFRRGQKPLFTERYHILEDETYKQITERYEKKIKESEKNIKEKADIIQNNTADFEPVSSISIIGPVITEEFHHYLQTKVNELIEFEKSLEKGTAKTDKVTAHFYKQEINETKKVLTDFITPNVGNSFYVSAIKLSEEYKRIAEYKNVSFNDKYSKWKIVNSIPYAEAYLSEFYGTIFLNQNYDRAVYKDYCEKRDVLPLKRIKGFESVQQKICEQWIFE